MLNATFYVDFKHRDLEGLFRVVFDNFDLLSSMQKFDHEEASASKFPSINWGWSQSLKLRLVYALERVNTKV